MKKIASLLLLLVATVVVSTAPLHAQQKRVSPHETISRVIDGNRVMIVYGRPYTKDPKTGNPRTVWGGLVPHGKVWRTGADEATLLVSQFPIVLGGATIPAGAHTLFTQFEEDGSGVLIVNKDIGQWGLSYDTAKDVARITLKKEVGAEAVDQFTMAVEKAPDGGGVIKLLWDKSIYSVPFTVRKP